MLLATPCIAFSPLLHAHMRPSDTPLHPANRLPLQLQLLHRDSEKNHLERSMLCECVHITHQHATWQCSACSVAIATTRLQHTCHQHRHTYVHLLHAATPTPTYPLYYSQPATPAAGTATEAAGTGTLFPREQSKSQSIQVQRCWLFKRIQTAGEAQRTSHCLMPAVPPLS